MKPARHGDEDMDDEAHALRRYVVARAAGRTMPEYVRIDVAMVPGALTEIASDKAEAGALCDGRRFREVRRKGLPWCPYLGTDTRISEDHALQAFFELHAAERDDWQRLKTEVNRNRRAALRNWRRQGRDAITRIRWEQAHGAHVDGVDAEAVHLSTPLVEEFRIPGRGMRSLKKTYELLR